MTKITLFYNARGMLYGFECKGHAGYAEEGSDIVCAAVSVLSTTCVNALESVAKVKPKVETKDGYMKMCLDEQNLPHDAVVLLQGFEQGIRDIAGSYPKYIHITER